jgi:PEP-CTERM motif-containing protein
MRKGIMLRNVLVVLAVLFVASPAFATTFTLNSSNCCGTGPFGDIVLSQVDGDTVDVLVTLKPGVGFVLTGSTAPGDHPDFAWTLTGAPSDVTITWIQTGGDSWTFYDRHSSPISMSDGFGTYQFALYCNGGPSCGPGGSHPNAGPIEFQVNSANITISSFIANSQGTIFAADVINGPPNGNGNTGLVRTTGGGRDITEVPEPATLTLLGLGLVGVAQRARRRLR